mmetsp:Transcript_59442/g.186317  ORF Transcript_59442/g.186317 Transcript_59442/m.186317 type:complete len:255 (-) Transcript_59442:1115-1879(-)
MPPGAAIGAASSGAGPTSVAGCSWSPVPATSSGRQKAATVLGVVSRSNRPRLRRQRRRRMLESRRFLRKRRRRMRTRRRLRRRARVELRMRMVRERRKKARRIGRRMTAACRTSTGYASAWVRGGERSSSSTGRTGFPKRISSGFASGVSTPCACHSAIGSSPAPHGETPTLARPCSTWTARWTSQRSLASRSSWTCTGIPVESLASRPAAGRTMLGPRRVGGEGRRCRSWRSSRAGMRGGVAWPGCRSPTSRA